MDWLTFIASETKALAAFAWPAVAAFFMYLFQKQIGGVITDLGKRLRRIKVPGGGEAEFGKGVQEARETEEQVLIATTKKEARLAASEKPDTAKFEAQVEPPPPTFSANDPLVALANVSPEAAVLQAFTNLEDLLIFESLWAEDTETAWSNLGSPLLEIVKDLKRRELVDGPTVDLFIRASNLRNIAAHASPTPGISVGEALEYVKICRTLVDTFKRAFAARRDPGGESD